MDLPVNPSAIVELLRAWFFAKDRSIIMADNTFIESDDNATSPSNPSVNRSRLFYQLANPPPGRGWYSLDEDGRKYQFSGDIASWQSVVSMFQNLTGLRGLWPMSSIDAAGGAFDLSANGRTLTYNGNPAYNFDGLIPYIDLDGTGDYLERADEAGFDILATESYISNPGITFGGWFWVANADMGTFVGLMSKWGNAGDKSYLLSKNANDTVGIWIESAILSQNAFSTSTLTAETWQFVVGRLIPTTEMSVWINDEKTSKTANIPASIRNSTVVFEISGFRSGLSVLEGRASMCFLCASALSDTIINTLYQQTRTLYGV